MGDSSYGNEETEEIEYPVVGRLCVSGERDGGVWSLCMDTFEYDDAYEVLMVGVGRGPYPLVVGGFKSEERLPEWLEVELLGENDQLCSVYGYWEDDTCGLWWA